MRPLVLETWDLSGLAVVVGTVAVILVPTYMRAARDRSRSRRSSSQVATTGRATWCCVIDAHDLRYLFDDLRVGFVRGMFLSEGVPMTLDLDSSGLRLTPRGWWMRRHAGRVWFAPWNEVLGAEARPVGFKTLGGKISLVRLTDVLISTVGASAHRFLDEWEFLAEVDEHGNSIVEDPAEQAEWLAFAKEALGPSWQPGSALLRLRTNAPEGMVDAIARWGRGRLPA